METALEVKSQLLLSLMQVASEPVALLLLAAVLAALAVRCVDYRDSTPAIVSGAYFSLCAIINMLMTPRYAVSLYLVMAIANIGLIVYILVSGSRRKLTKIAAVALLVMCAENCIMAGDEQDNGLFITLIYALDPFIQLAADAVFIAVGAISVIKRSDHDYI